MTDTGNAEDTNVQTAQKLADSAVLTLFARGAMILTLPVLGFMYSQIMSNLDLKFDRAQQNANIEAQKAVDTKALAIQSEINDKFSAYDVRFEVVTSRLADQGRRITEVQTQQNIESRSFIDALTQQNLKIDKLTEAVQALTNTVAVQVSTTAQMAEQLREIRIPANPPRELTPRH